MQNGDFDTTAEFTTQNNCYYLGCNNDGESVPVDEIDIKEAVYGIISIYGEQKENKPC